MSLANRPWLKAIFDNGVIITLIGMLMFALNDVLGKWLVSTYSAGQVNFIRASAALVVLLPFLMRTGWRPLVFVERPAMQATRAILASLEAVSFYIAVKYLPLADVMTYWLAAPIYIAAVSPFLLGETVGWRRWTAIGIGFLGVVVALQPSAAMFATPAAGVSIMGTMFFAAMLITGRALRKTPDVVMVFWQAVAAAVLGLVLILFEWKTPTWFDLLLLAQLGVVSMAAHVLINRALKLTDATTVAPLQYTLLFWAIVFGFIFFGDVPSVAMLIGAVLIVASGLFIFFRETQLKKKDRVLPAVPE